MLFHRVGLSLIPLFFPSKDGLRPMKRLTFEVCRERSKFLKFCFKLFLLTKERQRLKQLEEERLAAEKAMKEVHDKLAAAEEAFKRAAEEAKKKARELKTAEGLARTVGPNVP